MRQLISKFGYTADSFEIPDSADNSHDVLPGTPIYWTPPSYYEGESDSRTAREEYEGVLFDHETNWAAYARQEVIRMKYSVQGVAR